MVVNVHGTVSLKAFIGGIGVLVLYLPSIFSSAYYHVVAAWWIYILTIYVLLAIAVTRVAFKAYEFKVNFWRHMMRSDNSIIVITGIFTRLIHKHTNWR